MIKINAQKESWFLKEPNVKYDFQCQKINKK